jgi:hypothetical protein
VIPPCICPAFRINFISAAVSLDLSVDFTAQFSLPYTKIVRANVLYRFICGSFWTWFDLNVFELKRIFFPLLRDSDSLTASNKKSGSPWPLFGGRRDTVSVSS